MLKQNKPLDFDLEVYDEEGILVDEISCDHIAKACAVATELVTDLPFIFGGERGKHRIHSLEIKYQNNA